MHNLDADDSLAAYRQAFHFPAMPNGEKALYFCGNSLGLQPKTTKEAINQELDDWQRYGVEGHHHAKTPWVSYHETLTAQTARLVGALPREVVVMNSLTVNLHLMMVSFYRPDGARTKIIIEDSAFPSDRYAVESQLRFHGIDPQEGLIRLQPRPGEDCLRQDDILEIIAIQGQQTALIMLGNVNYLTGQAFDMKAIAAAGHKQGCNVGFDLAHGAGNLKLDLHDADVDFAVWCSYKYINAGPGGIAGCFVHERWADATNIPRFHGWWGHDKKERFKMAPEFKGIGGAETWQLSNPPIFQLAALRASMNLFDEAGIDRLRAKSVALTAYLIDLLKGQDAPMQSSEPLSTTPALETAHLKVITPRDPKQRGSQLSIRIDVANAHQKLSDAGVICDFREPDIIRIAAVPLYNSFQDVADFVKILTTLK